MKPYSEPHKISGASIDSTEARRILRLLDSGGAAQGELNRTALRLGLVTPQADAATTNRRLRDLAEGVMQQHRAGRHP